MSKINRRPASRPEVVSLNLPCCCRAQHEACTALTHAQGTAPSLPPPPPPCASHLQAQVVVNVVYLHLALSAVHRKDMKAGDAAQPSLGDGLVDKAAAQQRAFLLLMK